MQKSHDLGDVTCLILNVLYQFLHFRKRLGCNVLCIDRVELVSCFDRGDRIFKVSLGERQRGPDIQPRCNHIQKR